ncbi:putative aminopeptidase W07G4.4 [Tubulanus polymorphus]|uniref:putative aminopeptidase W07G4.4 n=1 Tax=Tubulanus polymorphus TaxID=672921 RepID=UPI003DA2D6DB
MADSRFHCPVFASNQLDDPQFDGIILIAKCIDSLPATLDSLKIPLKQYAEIDHSTNHVVILHTTLPSKRLIYSATGPLNRDQDDIRRYADAAGVGVQRAIDAGCKSPLLVCVPEIYTEVEKVTLLGALHTLYVPIEVRVDVPSRVSKFNKLGFYGENLQKTNEIIKICSGLENGRIIARDIGGSDPERMAAPNVAAYLEEVFANSCIKVSVISGHDVFEKDYPLLAAVNRCARLVERHDGRLIILEYEGEGPIDQTLFFVGKGITYDTGGADVKAGGHMAGMHRDKCGAAAVAGFMEVLSTFKPKGLKVISALCMVRNSIGSECYVADEIITSRAGVRIRIGNTDAEGRMVMTDVLCKAKEMALDAVNPHLFTIATLTGHAVLAMGPSYSIIMDNGPARKLGTAYSVQNAGDVMGDPFEISTVRREDYEAAKGPSEYEDVLQCNNSPSSRTDRGHQLPGAFMTMASGLDKHGNDSAKQIPYSHIDVAGSSGPFPGVPTGTPIIALATKYVLGRL